MAFRPRLALFALIVVASLPSAAEVSAAGDPESRLAAAFPDNMDVRAKLFSSLIGAPRELALSYEERVLQSASGLVLARAVKRADDFLVEFRNGSGGLFVSTTRGTCVIQRSNAKGNYILQAKIFLQDDPSCYLRLYPHPRGSSTLADIVMYGALLKQGMGMEGMLYQILVRPFTKIVEATRQSFDWSFVLSAGAGGTAAAFAAEIGEDSIPSRALSIARALEGAASVDAFVATDEVGGGAVEFTNSATPPAGFSAERNEIGAKVLYAEFPRYAAGKGIPLAALRAALYLDALSAPDSVYALFGEGLRALVLPRFDDSGRFGIALFQAGRERSWDELFAGRKDAGVRVIRLPSSLASPGIKD